MPSNKTFATIKSNVADEVGDRTSSFDTRIGVYANNRQRQIIDRLVNVNAYELYRTITLNLSAGVRSYPMPFDFMGEIVYIHDATSEREISYGSEQEWVQSYGSNLNQPGKPIFAFLQNESNVRVQPTASSVLKFVSSSSSDDSYTVFLRGISGSAEFYETASASGTSSASFSNSYDFILQLGKSGSTNGTVTFTYSDNSVASIISPQATEERFSRMAFHYKPDGSYTVNVREKRDPQPMVNANDHPVIDIADLIELGAKADAWRTKRFFSNAADFENRYEIELDRFMYQRMGQQVHQMAVTPINRSDSY